MDRTVTHARESVEETNTIEARERGAESSGDIAGGGSWKVFSTAEGFVLVTQVERGLRVKRRLPKIPETDSPEKRARFAASAAPEIRRLALAERETGLDTKKYDPKKMLFRDVGVLWTSGELAKRFPDYVREKKSSENDVSRLNHLYETIGDVPIDDPNWIAHGERAMSKLPKACKTPSSRRQYAQLISRVLSLAAYPLKLIPMVPFPKGFLPKVGGKKADQWLRPNEEARLMACLDVSLLRRLFWGFLAREGMRVSEALAMTWDSADRDVGAITLDENKSDNPRAWAADPGVIRALSAYYELLGRPAPTSRIFVDTKGVSLEGINHADAFRDDLKIAKVERAELFEKTKNRIPIRAHDLRATFITINLANGKTEAWIADRTGHTTSAMINRYRRSSRTAAELGLGPLKPLDEAIPELRPSKPGGDSSPEPERNSGDDRVPGEFHPSDAASAMVHEGAPASTSCGIARSDEEERAPTVPAPGLLDPLIGVRIPAPEPSQVPEARPSVVPLGQSLGQTSARGSSGKGSPTAPLMSSAAFT